MTSAERRAQNEGVFRDANEDLERGARDLLGPDEASLVPFLCECPNENCTQVVLLTLGEYERVRADAKQGLSVPGHEDLEIERVVEQYDRFTVTEKLGRAGEVHVENDPRE